MKAQASKGVTDEDMHDGQRNDLLRDMENRSKETKGKAYDIDNEDNDEAAETRGEKDSRKEKEKAEKKEKKIMKLEDVMVDWIKAGLKEWERHLEARPDEVKALAVGRAATAMQKQTKRYLKLLFEKLETGTCPGDIVSKVSKMINLVDKRSRHTLS